MYLICQTCTMLPAGWQSVTADEWKQPRKKCATWLIPSHLSPQTNAHCFLTSLFLAKQVKRSIQFSVLVDKTFIFQLQVAQFLSLVSEALNLIWNTWTARPWRQLFQEVLKPTEGTNLKGIQQWLSQHKNGGMHQKMGKTRRERKENPKSGVTKQNSEDVSNYKFQACELADINITVWTTQKKKASIFHSYESNKTGNKCIW